MNRTIFQFFHWYYSSEGNLWNHCRDEAAKLARLGVSDIWLPPAYKSAKGTAEPGYAVYDLFDLGEFDQKGTIRTRHGSKEEYLACITALHDQQIAVLADIVFNHKHGGDETEQITIVKVNADNRLEQISGPVQVKAHTKFTFPGRQGKYSDYTWDSRSFTGICEDGAIGLIQNEYTNGQWDEMLEQEKGNFDYLMGNDIEFRNPYVKEELKRWGEWYIETTAINGFRLDGLKHINPYFFLEWLDHLDRHFNKKFFCIGEYWQNNIDSLLRYTEISGGRIQLFDVPLHFNFHEASLKGDQFDMRAIFNNTLVGTRPDLAVTFVENHDTQPLQSLQSPVEAWFKYIAYALILLREQGIPCVFYPTLYDAKYFDKAMDGQDIYVELNQIDIVEKMMTIRKFLAYGFQQDYFDDPHIVGWTRQGPADTVTGGCAVLVSNAGDGEKWMSAGKKNAGKTMVEVSGSIPEEIVLNEQGEALFKVKTRSVAIWVANDGLNK